MIATFAGPPATRINDGKDELPFLVTMRYGSGKTVYLGSMETLAAARPRAPRTTSASGSSWPARRARRNAAEEVRPHPAGPHGVGGDDPGRGPAQGAATCCRCPDDQKPTLYVRKIAEDAAKPDAIDLKAKASEGDWTGWFASSVKIRDPGEYEFKIPVPGTGETLTQRLTVRKPNPELDNVRTNFGLLYQLASEAGPLLAKLPAESRKEVQKLLQTPATEESAKEGRDSGPRLFFPWRALNRWTAPRSRGAEARRGQGQARGPLGRWRFNRPGGQCACTLPSCAPLALGLLGFAILLFLRQMVGAWAFLGGFAMISLGVIVATSVMDLEWAMLPVDFSYVLIVVVTLLSIEWLTRKLLKLA